MTTFSPSLNKRNIRAILLSNRQGRERVPEGIYRAKEGRLIHLATQEQTNRSPLVTEVSQEETLSITDIARMLSLELSIDNGQIARTIALLDENNTVPFIARYRKEVTGSLDEVQIHQMPISLLHHRPLLNPKL